MSRLCILIAFVSYLTVFRYESGGTRAPITLQNGGYDGLLVAIHNSIPEDSQLIDRIKAVLTEGSDFLFTASKRRAYWKEVTIVIPKTWSQQPEYEPAKDESFERAHIIIDEPNPDWDDNPYTQQMGGCGIKGEYIHLTPRYLLDQENSEFIYGPAGKLIVHEWGHLRYGLFDEYFTSYEDPGVHPFYLDRRERLQGTRCSLEIQGINQMTETETFTSCTINRRTGLPERGCLFFPFPLENQHATGSVMYAQYLDSVNSWCHSNTDDPNGLHNREAPNKQNTLCGGKSTLDIILSTEDFNKDANLPIDDNVVVNTIPNFKLVQRRERRVAFVLDVSGSMDGDPLTQLLQVSSNYLRDTIDDGSHVGIVEFRDDASVLSNLRLISGHNSREALVASLPKNAMGRTSIGAGIQKGIQVLSGFDEKGPGGGYILLVSDGAENQEPLIEDILNDIQDAGVVIDTVAFSDMADKQLEMLAAKTGGFSFFYSGSDDTTSLNDAFTTTITRRPEEATDVNALPIQLSSDSKNIAPTTAEVGSVYIDSSLGNSTIFSFTWQNQRIEVELTGPDGTVIDSSNQDQYNADESLKMITIRIPGTAKSGRWTYVITNPSSRRQVVNVGSESKLVQDQVKPIIVTSRLSAAGVNFTEGLSPLIIYAQVKAGYQPVINASVTAIVDKGSDKQDVVKLFDNGAGADITKYDGLYSAYYFGFTGDGRYSVQIRVENTDGSAQLRTSGRSDSPAFNIRKGRLSEPTYETTDSFNRATSAGTFEVSNYDERMMTSDVFPPSRVIDLQVVSVSNNDKTVTLQWTAPGGDYDQGRGAEYDLRLSEDIDVLYDDFETATRLDNSSVVEGDLLTPLPAGAKERVTIKIDSATNRQAFAIRAIDGAGNTGASSNIAITSFYEPNEEVNIILISVIVIIVLLIIFVVVIVLIIVIMRRRNEKGSKSAAKSASYSKAPTAPNDTEEKQPSKKVIRGTKVMV
ncbi:calcium-activated chloride channel regulator 1-like [Glandiceps talaboti]